VPGGNAIGTANSGTRIQYAFSNIPAGATIYVPTTINNQPQMPVTVPVTPPSLVMTLTASATGPLTPVAANVPAGSTIPAGYAPLTAANGSATAVYEVTTTDNTFLTEAAVLAGYVVAAPNFANTAQPAITVTVSPAPTGSTNVPNFATSSNPALTLTSFSVCQTSLLFPYVVNQLGFDTGIVLSNTSTDPFAPGATATPQSGSCTLNFYGAGAPTPSTGVAAPGGTQATGTVDAFLLSSVAPGFQGYVIAQCNYLYGHGFAYIEYGMPNNNGTAMGYLAEVLTGRPVVGAAADGVTF
jgi:hypothetical protein